MAGITTTTTTATVLFPVPPPTVNRLDSHQRHRLMRSTDKLARVLGTTPYLLESDTLPPITLLPVGNANAKIHESKKAVKASRRERSVLGHSPSSSTSSLESTYSPYASSSMTSLPSSNGSTDALPFVPPRGFSDSKGKSKRSASPALFIRLNTVPVSPTDNRFASSLPQTPSPSTPLGSSTNYTFPPTPRTPTFNQSEVRRKRMAKLARHLGESIPPQLVFPNNGRKSSGSELAATSSVRNRKRRSMSVSSDWVLVPSELGVSQHKPSVSYCPKPSPTAPFIEEQENIVASTVERRDRQASWIGEWNHNDMQEVQRQLRALKGR